jgi:hypothetical protein
VALLARAGLPPVHRVLTAGPGGFEAALLDGARIGFEPVPVAEVESAANDELSTWHRFELAVRQRFNARQAPKLLAAINPTAALDALPLQTFVAQLVRAS